jgi:hypothetical protein
VLESLPHSSTIFLSPPKLPTLQVVEHRLRNFPVFLLLHVLPLISCINFSPLLVLLLHVLLRFCTVFATDEARNFIE